MKVEDLHNESQGEATAEYEVVVRMPGINIGHQPERFYKVGSVHRDTANKRLVLEPDELVEK